MIRSAYKAIWPIKFRLAIITLLCGASVISILLYQARMMMSGTLDYIFLIWNLFLAWIPLILAYATHAFAKSRKFVLVTVPSASILWLLFFPNAPYILTDLQHLSFPRVGAPVWYDMLLINWFAWTGILLGVFSLFMMHDIVRTTFGRFAGWSFVLIIGLFTSLGTYIGRFLRWNSWDLLFHPWIRMHEFVQYLLHPSMQAFIFIGVFCAFFTFIYISLYAFGLFFQEQSGQFQQEHP